MRAAILLLIATMAWCQPRYDVLLKGGHVIDGKNRINAVRDVAVKDGAIAAVAARIPASEASKTIDVRGLYVTPGLVDIHVHVYAGTGMRGAYSGDNSVYPDGHTFRSGVTSVVDAGSSGWRNFEDFKDRVIDRSKTRVFALLNIVGKGMGGGPIEQDVSDMDPKATAEMVKKYPQSAVGIKTAHFATKEWTAVDRGLEAAKLAGTPLMVDFGTFHKERPHEELVLQRLRPGDLYTHTFLSDVPMVDENGKFRPYLFEAQKRGVIFDVGHGGGSFVFRHAAPAIKAGFRPDSISTDLHITSMNAGMKDMLNVMSKFLNLGLPVDDVVIRSTWNPAKEMKLDAKYGHLSVGAPADIAVLRVRKGHFGFVDVYGARLKGTQKLECEMTMLGGRIMWDLNGIALEDWDKLPSNYGSQFH
ncbi:MAG: amidohydrolase/deacetylase family metallohydrolase [Bryobacteraceae bacterium]